MGDVVDDHEETQGALFLGSQQVSEKRGTHRPRAQGEKAVKPRGRSEPKSLSDPRYAREPRMSRGKRRPISIPHDPSESQLHQSIAELLDWILKPPAFFTTFPAGWGRLSKGTAGRLFASGLKKGMPDILVFDEGPKVVGIELKVGKNSVSSAQRAMFAQLQAVGITVYVCRSQEDVRTALYREFIDCRSIHDGTDKQESLR